MKKHLAVAAFVGIIGFVVAHFAPGVLQDYRIRNSVVPALDLQIEKAKCTTHWFIATTCSVSYRPRGAQPGAPTQSVGSFMIGRAGADRVMLMRSPRDGAVTTDVNIADLTKRTMALALFLAGLIGLIGVSAAQVFGGTAAVLTPRGRPS
jgi:hypothetical protein